MESNFILYGFVIGLTSNLHCIGMCGPIALAIPLNRSNNFTLLSGIFQYNLGRILVYAALGALIGSIGVTVETLGFLQWISIFTGIALILYAWRKFFTKYISSGKSGAGISPIISKGIGKVIRSESPLKLLLLGGLNGLLPCGMVYVGLMNALLTGNMLESSFAMMAFGIGTLPSMIAVAYAANKISPQLRTKINKAVPYLLTIVGVLIVLRGMNLNIPYISPGVKVEVTEEKTVKAEMSCCHSKDSCEK